MRAGARLALGRIGVKAHGVLGVALLLAPGMSGLVLAVLGLALMRWQQRG